MKDPRLTPARDDLAARELQGEVTAARFVDATIYEVVDGQAPLRRSPSPDAPLDSEALMGERVAVYEIDEGWAWGQLQSDLYVGYLPARALGPPGPEPTYKVGVPRTLVFPGPSIKLPPVTSLPFGARLGIERVEGALAVTSSGGYVPARHLATVDFNEPDFVAVAERLLGTPYLWGGKSNLGIDCSGLVQLALQACGISCPRDSDMQVQALGKPVRANDEYSNLERGDLMFWPGHVAIVRDPHTLIHANAFHMAVALEPIGEAVARISRAGSEVSSVRRL
jgi:cell wall-associated NlpC family hydrolase